MRRARGVLIYVSRMDHEEYVKLAAVEDRMWYFRALHRHALRELDRALPPDRRARVLDAGCGTGGLVGFLSRFSLDRMVEVEALRSRSQRR